MRFGTHREAEPVVHAVRPYLEHPQDEECRVLLKLDFRNAFNTVHQDEILRTVNTDLSQYYAFLWQFYRHPSRLVYGNEAIFP